jgi:hypothetical protein
MKKSIWFTTLFLIVGAARGLDYGVILRENLTAGVIAGSGLFYRARAAECAGEVPVSFYSQTGEGIEPIPYAVDARKRVLFVTQRQETEWRDGLATTAPLLRHRIILKGDYKLICTRKSETALERWK